jgi:endonuclease G, mitochondrial
MLKKYRTQITILCLMLLVLTSLSIFKADANQQGVSTELGEQARQKEQEIQFVQMEEDSNLFPLQDFQINGKEIDLEDGFESGIKRSYAAEYLLLESGLWYIENAKIGRSSNDRKTGERALRITENGIVRMEFDRAGAGSISIQHAVYGMDQPSTWELWYSTDGGENYKKAGQEIYTFSTTLQTTVFVFNIAGPIRFEIRKIGGGDNRINIDNIEISSKTVGRPAYASTSGHLTMGNPSGAVTSTGSPSNYLMSKTQYVLSYHRYRGTPNWVSWHLDSSDLGSAPRQDDFRSDTTLPSGWYRVVTSDYTNTGYDRGHMCPSADRTNSISSNSATFLMTNIIPQAPNNNRGPWANLENYTRDLVNAGNECYVISGSYGFSGTIDGGNITIPARTWKVIVVLPIGSSDAARVVTGTRVIAVNMPNSNSINTNWKTYRVSVDSIESATGYNLLSNVASSVQSVIESRVDAVP